MKKTIFFLCLIVAAALQNFEQDAFAQPPARSGYDVGWYDEFDGDTLDLTKWTPADNFQPTNNSIHDYLPSQVTVTGGNLRILSEDVPSRGWPTRSGLVESKSYQKYGRWDIRAKLPTSRGMWPAIWLLANEAIHPWPSGGEIDIMENRGDEPNLTSSAFHYGPNFSGHQFRYAEQTAVHDGFLQDYHSGFHTYSVEWDPDQVRFYVDDVHHWTLRNSDVGGFLVDDVEDMRLIINTAIGGTFLDNPDNTTVWPQEFLVDYVHTYTKSATPPTLTFDNGGFEENGGSLAHWTTFGKTLFNNMSSGNQNVDEGAESLKLFGQFNGQQNFSGLEQGISVSAGDELRATARSFVSSGDSISGSNNRAYLKIDYYNKNYGLFGSSEYISSDSIVIADGSTQNNLWMDNELLSIAPSGAVEARLAIVFEQNADAGGAVFVDDVQFAIAKEPVVESVELNVGEAQRSSLESLTLTFEGEVTLGAGAVTVVQRSTQTEETFETVTTSFTQESVDNQTIVNVQFESHVRNSANALVDGNYQITLTGSLVTRGGISMSEDFVFGAVEADQFYTLYGDGDGNRSIDIFDLLTFRQAFNTVDGMDGFEAFLDFNADGSINIFDLLPFRTRFSTSIPFTFGGSKFSRLKAAGATSQPAVKATANRR